MKVRNIVRKAAVLGSSAALVGTTLMGALAYDLGTYPAKFIVDGQFDGKIVLGEKAAMVDMLGAVDIATGLQQAAVKKIALPGQAGQVSVSGDAFEVGTSSDALELRENIGDVAETLTVDDLKGLKGGRITTPEGSTNYQQFIRLKDGSDIQDIAVNYVTNDGEDNEKMSDFMVVQSATLPFIQWEVQFDDGLEGELGDGATAAADDIEDFEDRAINIMGSDYTIVSAEVEDDGTDFEATLMGGSIARSLREGESETYSIDGVDYTVTLLFVSDPSTTGGANEAKFSVNGELTQAMEEGDTDTLSGGLQIGVRDVLVNSREGVASFFLGANKLVLTHPTSDGTFTGDIEINEETDESNVLAVEGTAVVGATYEITSIKYRVVMDSAEGSGGVAYVPKGHGVRELMDEPELLISDALDIQYQGLTTPKTSTVLFDPNGDDEYTLSFTNIDGKVYKNVPLLSTDGSLKFGDQDDDLVIAEEATEASANIGIDDYFIVSSKQAAEGDRAVTNVLRYVEYDGESRKIEFEDLAGGSVSSTLDTTGSGTFNVGGHTYDVTVNISGVSNSTADDANIIVDLDGDDSITDNEVPVITSWGGLFFELAAVKNSTGSTPAFITIIGDGKTVTGSVTPGAVTVTFEGNVLERNFDTASGDELFNLTIAENSALDELDIDFVDSTYVGPLDGSDIWNSFDFEDMEDNSDTQTGMTDYGILVSLDEQDDDPNTLSFEVPEEQRLAQIYVTMGDVSASEGDAGTADKVNPIDLGIAVVDSDAAGLLGSENLIVVGGPCANSVAATLMGSGADCAAGFEAGKAVIKAWDKGDTVAVLVAGYDARDTQVASRVLATKGAGALKGSEVEIVVNSLTDYKINSMS